MSLIFSFASLAPKAPSAYKDHAGHALRPLFFVLISWMWSPGVGQSLVPLNINFTVGKTMAQLSKEAIFKPHVG